ncbi:MAG: IS630 family transposase [Alphaproteobacteria bacterium]|nr:IS630 family transposase [Alphaproteobacteria bacterium]
MTQPYSSDLRERVVRAHLAGQPIRQVAARFGVSVSSVPKWVARYRATGSVAPGRIGGHRPWLLEPHRELVHRLVAETPHLSIDRLRDLLAAAGIAVSRDTIWRFLRREGLSFKKTLFATEQVRAAVARKRARWQALKRHLDTDRLVFVDETWIKTNMAPLRGWAQRGQRLKGYEPHGHWRTMTFLAALRSDGIGAPCVFDGPINTRCFQTWVEQELVPTLKPGDIVILDNLASHKSKAVRQAIRNTGARLWFLPPYSPDLNPIEQAFAKIKHWMRNAQRRDFEDTRRHLGNLIATIEPSECQNYIRNVGYGSV